MIGIKQRLLELQEILKENSIFFSQEDEQVIKGDYIDHPWLNELLSLSTQDFFHFDGQRNYKLIADPGWQKLIEKIDTLTSFTAIERKDELPNFLGRRKKRHELSQLSNLNELKDHKMIYDFGGGVGNLSYFLEHDLNLNPTIIEADSDLIATGEKKMLKLNSDIKFIKHKITPDSQINLNANSCAIGLHTCGNFAPDMMKLCIDNKLERIINFGCCYSKIEDDRYHLSSLSNKSLFLNHRALSYATLGFSKMPEEFWHFRNKIVKYKMSYYNWVYGNYGIIEFQSMSNSRRSLYDLDFDQFVEKTITKYAKDYSIISEEELNTFLESKENLKLVNYLQSYYAIARYFGKAIEAYILCDRAMYLEENGYEVQIKEVFDPQMSPRNKAIVGKRV